jgi:hypothetical protein
LILNEQKYGTKRIWWHGSKTGELIPTTNHTFIPMIWLTSDPHHTLKFVNEKSFFLKCKLKEPLQIFNGLSTVDLWKLNKKLPMLSDSQITIIKNLDWFAIRNSYYNQYRGERLLLRDDLIKAIYELKYDGFSNFESQQQEKKKNPTIGLFDESKVFIKEIFTFKEFLEETRIDNIFELDSMSYKMYYEKFEGKTDDQIRKEILREYTYDNGFINYHEAFDIIDTTLDIKYGKIKIR